MSMLTTIINLYCLLTMLKVDSLRKTEFCLVAAQTVVDLFISGVAAFIYYTPRVVEFFFEMCYYSAMANKRDEWTASKFSKQHKC